MVVPTLKVVPFDVAKDTDEVAMNVLAVTAPPSK